MSSEGAWVLDLANEVPSNISIYGCDISTTNFPSSYPRNVYFHEASSSSFPVEWNEKFDVVNQRLLVAGLSKEQWPAVLSEYLRVTKPGGYVQIAECDISKIILAGPATRRMSETIVELLERKGVMYDAPRRLAQMLRDTGFEEVREEIKYGPAGKCWGKMGELGSASNSGPIERLLPAFVEEGLATQQESTRLFEEMMKEFDTVEGMRLVYHIVCARKPL